MTDSQPSQSPQPERSVPGPKVHDPVESAIAATNERLSVIEGRLAKLESENIRSDERWKMTKVAVSAIFTGVITFLVYLASKLFDKSP